MTSEPQRELADRTEGPPGHGPTRADVLWRWLTVGSVLFVGYAGGAVGDVVGTSGLVATGGPEYLLGLWLLDASIALVAAGAVAAVVDRLDRMVLMRRVVLAAAALACAYAALLGRSPPGTLAFVAVAVGERLQNCVIYYTAWSLARDAFGADLVALTRLRFIATLGQLAGASLAGGMTKIGLSRPWLFVLLALGLVIVERVLAIGNRRGSILPSRTALGSSIPPPAPAFASLRPSARPTSASQSQPPRGLGRYRALLRGSRQLRNLLLLGVVNGVGYSVLALLLARTLEGNHGDADSLQSSYGILRAIEPFAYAVTELLLAPLVVPRMGAARAMVVTPVVLLLSIGALALFPRGAVGMVGSAALQASFAIEVPALSLSIASLPSKLRASVGVLLDSTPYTLGYILAVGLLGAVIALEATFAISDGFSRALVAGIGITTSAIGFFAIRRVLAAQREPRQPIPVARVPAEALRYHDDG